MKGYREPLEEMFDFNGIFFPPSARILTGNCLKEFGSVLIPATKGLDDQRLKENPLGATVVEVVPNLGGFTHLDGCGGNVGGAMKDSFLYRGNDADIKGYFATIDPVFDENVSRTRERAGDETRHFLFRVKRCVLRLHEDLVPNPVVSASFHPMIIAAVECVVTQLVLGMVAVDGTAF